MPTGHLALTQYLLQSLICIWIFNGHGLGLYGKVPISHYLLGGTVLFALQVWSSHLWLDRFRMGPAEWLWRRLSYGGPQRFKLSSPPPATAKARA